MLPPISRKLIVHVDMNSYFASVEQQANPFLRGRPLGVCAYLREYGCVIAASIEAKRLGMKVGMTVKQARERVPGAVFVENDPAKYRAVTSRVFSILHEYSDQVEHYSIDEAFLDVTDWYRDAAEAAWVFTRVRRRIRDEVGEWLRCSIGIAPTRFLAKTASDMEKPNGLVVINQENLDVILDRLDLEDVCGIGPRTRKRLERLGYYRLLEVKRAPIGNLMRAFGKQGLFLWCKLHGMEFEKVVPADAKLPKSVGHSYCVPDRVNQEGKIEATLMRLTERAGRRMRSLGLRAR
jgi:DNA polymerase-4